MQQIIPSFATHSMSWREQRRKKPHPYKPRPHLIAKCHISTQQQKANRNNHSNCRRAYSYAIS